MMNNDTSREERLKRIQDGLPPLDSRVNMPSSNRALSIRGGSSPQTRAFNGQKRGVEISDAAANLIAQALKTLLHS